MNTSLLRRLWCGLVLAMTLAWTAGPATAVTPDEMLPNKGLEARARALSVNLRCLVCQNQSIDDSDAPLARDLRRVVRERLTAGDSDGEVMAFIVQRYGDFVLLTPPFRLDTLLLWLTPVLVLLGGGLMVARTLGSSGRPVQAATEPLSTDEEARLIAILDAAAEERPPLVS